MEELYTQLAALAQQYRSEAAGAVRLPRPEEITTNAVTLTWLFTVCRSKTVGPSGWKPRSCPTLLKLDIVHISSGMNPKFLHNIEKDGVALYDSEA